MFSTTPRIGQCTWRNILTARLASSSATSWGVVTITAPSSETCCASVNCASPVPGGRSTTRKSWLPHSVSLRNWRTAPITIGPRQITGAFSPRKNPIEINFTPYFSIGKKFCPPANVEHHRHRRPVDVGVEQPHAEPQSRERHRNIRRHRRFAHTALAAAHRDDVLGAL